MMAKNFYFLLKVERGPNSELRCKRVDKRKWTTDRQRTTERGIFPNYNPSCKERIRPENCNFLFWKKNCLVTGHFQSTSNPDCLISYFVFIFILGNCSGPIICRSFIGVCLPYAQYQYLDQGGSSHRRGKLSLSPIPSLTTRQVLKI